MTAKRDFNLPIVFHYQHKNTTIIGSHIEKAKHVNTYN